MTHSPKKSNTSSNMDHESTIINHNNRPILPPISSMDGIFASRSWPPPATSLASTSLASPYAGSTSSNITMHENNTLSRNKNEPWSPIPKQKEHQRRLDYFTMTATANALSNAAAEDYHHYRQNSLPQISTFRKNSITNSSSSSYHSLIDQNQHNNTPPSSSSINHLTNSGTTNSSNNNNNASIELVLTPNSLSTPSIRSIERDIEEVIRHCNSLSNNMNQKKSSIVETDDNYFSNPTLMGPWLDDMISRANEVLNALLRLRKHQLAAEHARLHRIPDHQHLGRTDRQENEGWDTTANIIPSSSNSVISLNSSGRLRKRGKRPVFQGRCHSCNISETPEWRRGPDGARTLCNACGLHYAKLSKKKVKQDDDVKKETLEEQDRDDTSMK